MSTRRKSRSTQLNRKPIELSDVRYNSTCITLQIPLSLACLTCEPKLCIHTKKGRQQKALERLKDDRNKCDQLWLTKVATNQRCPTSKLMRHNQIRTYLGIESDVILEFTNKNTTQLKDIPTTIPPTKLVSPIPTDPPIVNPPPTPPSVMLENEYCFCCLPTDPPSFLLKKETTRKLPQKILDASSKLKKRYCEA